MDLHQFVSYLWDFGITDLQLLSHINNPPLLFAHFVQHEENTQII